MEPAKYNETYTWLEPAKYNETYTKMEPDNQYICYYGLSDDTNCPLFRIDYLGLRFYILNYNMKYIWQKKNGV